MMKPAERAENLLADLFGHADHAAAQALEHDLHITTTGLLEELGASALGVP